MSSTTNKTFVAAFLLCMSGLFSLCWADDAQPLLVFENTEQQQRYHDLIDELRCPKCQNQNLADSDAPIASDLRKQLFDLLLAGKSDAEILDYMTTRYGSFVLYEPPLNRHTLMLWMLPLAIMLLGAFLLLRMVRMMRSNNLAADTDDLDEAVKKLREQVHKDNA